MRRVNETGTVDLASIELEARRLRARAMASGIDSFRRWVAAPFTTHR